jgi:hypothetical protein
MPQIKVITPIDLNPNDFDLGILVANKISTKKTQADWNETLATAPGFILNKPALTGTAPIDLLTSTSTTAPLSANQGKVLKDLVDNKMKKTTGTVTGDKVLISSGATGVDNVESTVTKTQLEALPAEVATATTTNATQDTAITALQTSQTAQDVVIADKRNKGTAPSAGKVMIESATGLDNTSSTVDVALLEGFDARITALVPTNKDKGSLPAGGSKATPTVLTAASFPTLLKDGEYLAVPTTATDGYFTLPDGTVEKLTVGDRIAFDASNSTYKVIPAGDNQTASEVPATPIVASPTSIGLSSGDTAGQLAELAAAIKSIPGATPQTADNGLTQNTANNTQLGGALITPTTITTTAANTLAIAGLTTGIATDTGLVVDAAGVIKKAPAATAPYQELGKVIAPFTNYTVPHAQGDINPNIGIYVTSTNGFGKVNVFGNNVDSDNIFVFDPTTADVKIRNNSADPITVDIYIKK